ncbi:type I secretion system permease/ATPase [Palleronia abyssalis]|uniref:Type I secretion system ATP-binding protein PrsD n=1 Tax=Palleronia abyssalis TaxID=1501240 RepID=A0A2R8BSF5_9RHOB|nr:type I secretion system permease/ATPase [Palleronia abyssalis]SPJ23078.1 Type I secretion system ATP-binding protein PrsD [Palleronia abyssalis]
MQSEFARQRGRDELRAIRAESRGLFAAVAVFSLFVNLLMLTGPLYMLQVYDRVLGSRSEATLIALTLLMAFLFGIMGLLDAARARVLSRIGARFQAKLDRRVFEATMQSPSSRTQGGPSNGLGDLEAVRRLLSSTMLTALFDLPWTPIFLAIIFLFHPLLGALALGGMIVLILVTLINQALSHGAQSRGQVATLQAQQMSDRLRAEAETVRALGMRDSAFSRWDDLRSMSLRESVRGAEANAMFSSMTKTLRLFLQSLMLGLGAWLVLQEQMTPGGMIAGSIMMGRALAPIDLALNQWPLLQRARMGWTGLADLLGHVPPEAPRTELPRPRARLVAEQVTVIPPEQSQATLRMVSFEVLPGTAMGVIGPSGSGKSTLARALVNAWAPAGGRIRLDGAALAQYSPDALGRHIGYLPQNVRLFDGTIAQNIARLDPGAQAADIVAAGRLAGAHDMITEFPDGYDTLVSATGGRLSGGQIQRIGLARALYGDPVLLVLDEPNSNLDNDGTLALGTAIEQVKSRGGAVIIMAHRPAAIQQCGSILVLEGGVRRAFGPKDEVLREVTKNHLAIAGGTERGGVS